MDRRRTGALVAVAMALLAATLLVPGRSDGPMATSGGGAAWPTGTATAPFPGAGSLARDFALPRLHAEAPWAGPDSLRLSDFAGRWVYLDVFGTWCPPCRTKYPTMVEVARSMEEKGAMVVGLLLEDDAETAARWLEENGGMAYPFAVLDEATTRAWQLTGAPMGFLLSPEGRIEKMCYGCARGADAVELLPELVGPGS